MFSSKDGVEISHAKHFIVNMCNLPGVTLVHDCPLVLLKQSEDIMYCSLSFALKEKIYVSEFRNIQDGCHIQ